MINSERFYFKMQIETPYRTSAASSLEMKIIGLGHQFENLRESELPLGKFALDIEDTLKKFGYKEIYHRDLINNDSSIICLNYYNLDKRLVVFYSFKIKEHTGLIGFGHDDYYARTININYIDKCDILDDIAKLYSIPKKLRNFFLPGLFEENDRIIAVKCMGNSSKVINNFRDFLRMF